jgi:hypothetical protein
MFGSGTSVCRRPDHIIVKQATARLPIDQVRAVGGIGGGIPGDEEDDIRLGDVVVSKPTATFGGVVVQYDVGKVTVGGIIAVKQEWEAIRTTTELLICEVIRDEMQHGPSKSFGDVYAKQANNRPIN